MVNTAGSNEEKVKVTTRTGNSRKPYEPLKNNHEGIQNLLINSAPTDNALVNDYIALGYSLSEAKEAAKNVIDCYREESQPIYQC